MALEVATTIDGLVVTNPNQNDAVGAGDDHLRLLKTCILGSFPNIQKFGFTQKQDTALVITALQNTNRFVVSTSATVSVAFTLPASASITAGWSCGFLTLAGASAVIAASGTNSINGAASFSVPPESLGLISYYGNGAFVGSAMPSGLTGNLLVSGGLTVSGAASFGGTMTISGAATLNGTLSVSGAATFKTNISVSGNATFQGTTTMSGAVTMNSTLTVSAATSLGGTLSVSGASVFNGVATFNGAVTFSAAATFNAATTFSAAVTMKATLSVSGASTLGGALSVSGASVFTGTIAGRSPVTFDQTLSVSGAAVLGSMVTTNATVLGTLTVSGSSLLAGAVTTGALSINGETTISGGCTIKGSMSISGNVAIGGTMVLSGGQISFPATQNPSAGANVLDDYEEGTWTPVFTTVTPGDLGITGASVAGNYTKIGNTVHVWFVYTATTCTHTTAAGSMVITGIPFAIGATTCGAIITGALDNITLTDFSGAAVSAIGGNSRFDIGLNNLNNGAATQSLTIAGHTSGSGLFFIGQCTYRV